MRLLKFQFQKHPPKELMLEDSKEPELLKQLIYKLQQSFLISGENVFQ